MHCRITGIYVYSRSLSLFFSMPLQHKMDLAQRLRIIRALKGLTQENIAHELGMSQSAYSQIERKAGECKFSTLARIAQVLGVSATFLVDVDNPRYEEGKS
jgi:transcriptional regulator with XRE-family HTH domain